MKKIALVVLALGTMIQVAVAQTQPPVGSTPPFPPPEKSDRSAVDYGTRPHPGDVRAGNANGDSPSASAGTLERRENARRFLGLPVSAAIVIGGIVLVLFVIGGVVIPGARRRARARGNGTYGRP